MHNDVINNFIDQVISIDKVCIYYKNDIDSIINLIGKYIIDTLEKIKNVHNDLYNEFIIKITQQSLDYAGSMTISEFNQFCVECKNNCLTINNSRNIINMLWSFIKVVVSNIIFIGVTSKQDENYLTFKNGIKNGIKYLQTFMNFNDQLLLSVITEGFDKMELSFGTENIHTINCNQFYKYIIRLSLLEPRIVADLQKAERQSGFIVDKIYKQSEIFRLIINKYLLHTELTYTENFDTVPFTGSMIGSVNVNTNYYRFCAINNIYNVCGLSGSTFELMMYVLMLDMVNIHNKIHLKSLMALFLHFHLIRGTHSDLEVVCAFEKLILWHPYLKQTCNNILLDGVIVFNKGKLSENLLLDFFSDDEKLKYRLC